MAVGQRIQEAVRRRLDRQAGEQGFTLIELLVVIIILGILAAVVVFAVGGAGDKGALAAAKQDVRTLRTAEEAHLANNGRYATEGQLVTGGLLSEESAGHDVILIGDPGTAQSYRITCAASVATCGPDGAVPTGGIIRVGLGNGESPQSALVTGNNFVNPAVTSGGTAHNHSEYMFNGLLRWADNNTAQPDLAVALPQVNAQQTQATFTMRPAGPNYVWHDASPIKASDVKFTFEQALLKFHGRTAPSMGPALGVIGSGGGAVVPSGRVTNPTADSVQFNFIAPYAPLLVQMNVTEAPILPEAVYSPCRYGGGTANINTSGCGPNNPANVTDLITPPGQVRPIGSGPFMLKQRNQTTADLTFVKFPNYHFAGLPLANELQQKSIDVTVNSEAVGDAIKAGTVDFGTVRNDRIPPFVSGPFPDLTPAAGFASAKVPRGTGGGNCVLTQAFNLWSYGQPPATINNKGVNAAYDHPIWGDPTPIAAGPGVPPEIVGLSRGLVVRKALLLAVDRQAVVDTQEFGKGAAATAPYHRLVPGHSANVLPAKNIALANDYLDAAGWTISGGIRKSSFTLPDGRLSSTPLAWIFRRGTFLQDLYYQTIRDQLLADETSGGISVDIDDPSATTFPAFSGGTAGPGGPYPAAETNTAISSHFSPRDYDMITVSYCNGDDATVGARRQYYAGTAPAANRSSITASTNATTTITGPFAAADAGKNILGSGIPPGTGISAVTPGVSATMTAAATTTVAGGTFTLHSGAASQIQTAGFTNAAGYRSSTMDALWDTAAQSSSSATHAAIQAEAAANVPYLWVFESENNRAWRPAKCNGWNNLNTGLFAETAGCRT